MRKDMAQKQKRYFEKLPKSHYMPHELMQILDIPYSEAKGLTEGTAKTDKGYPKIDIIINLMDGMLYAK